MTGWLQVPAAGELWPHRWIPNRHARVLGVVQDALFDGRVVVVLGYPSSSAVAALVLDEFHHAYSPPAAVETVTPLRSVPS